VISTSPIGQAPQAIAYVPNAVLQGDGRQGLKALGLASGVTHVLLGQTAKANAHPLSEAPTSVSLFDQGLTQILEAAVSGLEPGASYFLAFSSTADGAAGSLEALAVFTANPAGSAIVNAVGPIRQVIKGENVSPRRYLVIVSGTPSSPGKVVQVQIP
jgi:hypothetical protein